MDLREVISRAWPQLEDRLKQTLLRELSTRAVAGEAADRAAKFFSRVLIKGIDGVANIVARVVGSVDRDRAEQLVVEWFDQVADEVRAVLETAMEYAPVQLELAIVEREHGKRSAEAKEVRSRREAAETQVRTAVGRTFAALMGGDPGGKPDG